MEKHYPDLTGAFIAYMCAFDAFHRGEPLTVLPAVIIAAFWVYRGWDWLAIRHFLILNRIIKKEKDE